MNSTSPKSGKRTLPDIDKKLHDFCDVYLVLGDVYFREGNNELAYRCYWLAEN